MRRVLLPAFAALLAFSPLQAAAAEKEKSIFFKTGAYFGVVLASCAYYEDGYLQKDGMTIMFESMEVEKLLNPLVETYPDMWAKFFKWMGGGNDKTFCDGIIGVNGYRK